MGGSEKGCEWWLGAIVNKIEISNPKISLIYYIDTPPNSTSDNMLAIADSDANIQLEKIHPYNGPCNYGKWNEINTTGWKHNEFLIYSNTLATRSKQASEVDPHFLELKTASLISLGVLCDGGYTITLDKQEISIRKNEKEISKGTRNKTTGMW